MSEAPLLTPDEEMVIEAKIVAGDPPEPILDAADLPDDVRDGRVDEDDTRTPEDV